MGRKSETLFEPIEETLRVVAVISSSEMTLEDGGKVPLWWCRFEACVGDERVAFWSASRFHYGPRKGKAWQEVKAHWRKQYDYIKRHVGKSLIYLGNQLAKEAEIVERAAWGELDWQAFFEKTEAGLDRRMKEIHQLPRVTDKETWKAHAQIDALVQLIFNLHHMQHRIEGFVRERNGRQAAQAEPPDAKEELIRQTVEEMAEAQLEIQIKTGKPKKFTKAAFNSALPFYRSYSTVYYHFGSDLERIEQMYYAKCEKLTAQLKSVESVESVENEDIVRNY